MSDPSRARLSAADRARAPGLVAPLVGVALIVAALVVARSPFFALREMAVSGNRILSVGEVRGLTGVEARANLHGIEPARVRSRLTDSPWIRDAHVARDLPGTLRVHIVERVPVGVVDAGARVAVGEDGVVVAAAREATARIGALPDLGPSRGAGRPGARLRIARSVLRVAASFPERLRRSVSSVAERRGEISMMLGKGGVVRYGTAASLPQKNAAVLALIRYARQHDITIGVIDVRSPTAPALRPAAPG